MYRFLLSPRWLGAAALTIAASVVMVFLGNWQLHRYHERSAINERIDAADSAEAVAMTSIVAAPSVAGQPGPAPGKDLAWTKVTLTGHYDATHEVQARGRTVDGLVGFEILTPLMLTDGTAVLVDRGWVPSADGTATSPPKSSPAPSGQVTVVGQIHLSESRGTDVAQRDGRIDTRRVSLPKLAPSFPYPIYGAYVLESSPAEGFTKISIEHEDAWQNGGYAVQWWIFSVMALLTFGWQARKEATGDRPKKHVDRVDGTDRVAQTVPAAREPGA